jgi:hypothetical protein
MCDAKDSEARLVYMARIEKYLAVQYWAGAEPVEVVEDSCRITQEAGDQAMVCVPSMKDGNWLRHLRNH